MSYTNNQQMLESRQLFDYIKLGKEATIRVAVVLADNKHNQFVSNQMSPNNELKNELISLINLENQLNNSIKASIKTEEEIRQLISDSENDENNTIINANVSQIFDEKLAQISGENTTLLENDVQYKQLMDIISEFSDHSNDNNDEDLRIEEREERIPVDPFTKKEIQNPVRNKKCNHIYDRDGLRLVLESRPATNPRLRCPYVGCNNNSVTMADVSDDRRTQALIHKLKRQQTDH